MDLEKSQVCGPAVFGLSTTHTKHTLKNVLLIYDSMKQHINKMDISL